MPRWLKIIAAVLVVLLVATGIGFASLTSVATGTKLVCKYNHTIRENISSTVVPRWSADDYGVLKTTITCQKHKRLEKLRADALAALEAGDTETAKKLFTEIRRIDPTFADVNTQLDRIAAKQPSPSSPGAPPNPAEPVPVIDLPSMLPASLNGYKTGELDAGAAYASRNYRPDSQGKMQSLLATVHSAGTQTGAEQFIIRVDQAGFPKNAKNITVNGYAAYFGTNGTTYATLAWAKGTIVYELQAHSSAGNPAGLEQDLIALAAAFN